MASGNGGGEEAAPVRQPSHGATGSGPEGHGARGDHGRGWAVVEAEGLSVSGEASAEGESGLWNRRKEEKRRESERLTARCGMRQLSVNNRPLTEGKARGRRGRRGGTLDRLEIPVPSVKGRGTGRERVGVEDMNLRSPAQSSKTRPKCGGGAAKQKKTEAEFAPMIGG